ncbi:MAG: sigma-54-dependent transcriptional regulator [Cyclobacteriaceae bacterium]|jgi:DNA-binding NtrC family response regulator
MYEKDPVKLFVVEDDPAYTRFLRFVVELNPDIEPTFFSSGQECLNHLHLHPTIITLDYSLPDMTGEKLLAAIREFDPEISVIVISAQEKIRTAVELLKRGALDYIGKDETTRDRLLNAIQIARDKSSLVREIDHLKKEIAGKYDFEKSIIGSSQAMKGVFALLEKAVHSNISVSITGETGTGKELVAKAIHYSSERKNKPFVAVNVTAIPKDLIESELFGHEKGAFTGALSRRIGKFEEADGGTLFLDEIGEMDPGMQAKLLRVLQEKEISRVGGNDMIKLDVRIVTATHRDLQSEVRAGNFREDLFYRLLGLPVHLPPLRERGQDVLLLARHFLNQYAKENKATRLKLHEEACEKLIGYSYPGNVRELKSIIDLAAVMSDGEQILPDDIRFPIAGQSGDWLKTEMPLDHHIYRIIRSYLNRYENNVLLVARKLNIGKSTIYRYLKEMEQLGI